MTDLVQAAIINGSFTVVCVVVSRLMSHFEHKDTGRKVAKIEQMVNGQLVLAKAEAFAEGVKSETDKNP